MRERSVLGCIPSSSAAPPGPAILPQLRASENMLALQEELSSTENRIAFSRQHYNDSVMEYNTARETFPAVLVSGMLGFRPEALFTLDPAAPERAVPQVAF